MSEEMITFARQWFMRGFGIAWVTFALAFAIRAALAHGRKHT